MPRYEYRKLAPLPDAQKSFDSWLEWLDKQFANKDIAHRSEIVRDVLHDIYLGRPYAPPSASATLSEQSLIHSFDPRNATLEPEYYGDIDGAKYAERKPLIWFWMMYDRSPLALNHALGYRVRAIIAKHVLKHIGQNVKIFHGVEISFGYNLTIEDNCTIHKYVLLDDRGELIIRAGSSISDYANVYTHDHDLNDGMIIANHRTEIGPKARVTYHATVMAGTNIGEHGLVGALGVATKDVAPYTIVAGIPSKPIKVKTIAPK
jgi:acetyltransferase-like isoleucine patch superfamily enzyme